MEVRGGKQNKIQSFLVTKDSLNKTPAKVDLI